MDYREQYDHWINSEHIEEEHKSILRKMSEDEIYEAFYKNAEFGTAGMRGIMGMGTNRLNIYTIRMASKGLAKMLLANKSAGDISVAIAYDTRNNSIAFAEETAKVLAAEGIKAYLFDRYSPVPLLSYGVRHLSCDAGVVITASHNTKEYNGFKVYDNTGSQMNPDLASVISNNIDDMADKLAIEVSDINDKNIEVIGSEISDAFMKEAELCGKAKEEGYDEGAAAEDLKVVYTSIHGAGRDFVMDTLKAAGFKNVTLVESQAEFDGDFPTVKKPNPEDSQALKEATDIAFARGADIVIGTDPDCDRIGVGVIDGNKVTYLTGNETGVLLIDYLLRFIGKDRKKTVITSIVTSELGPILAKDNGVEVIRTLTGFKFIGEVMNAMAAEGRESEILMGYEESYGYLTGTHARDKDGVSSAVAICRMAAYHKSKGKKLTDILEDIFNKYGYWVDSQQSLIYEGSDGELAMKEIMKTLRDKKASIFSGEGNERDSISSVKYEDYSEGTGALPKANVLKYTFEDNSWIAVRPSGTEPKIKVYYCIRGNTRAEAMAKRDKAKETIMLI